MSTTSAVFDSSLPGRIDPMAHMLVIDKSPSMQERDYSPCRLIAALQAATAYVQWLRDNAPADIVSAVVYSRWARVLFPWTEARRMPPPDSWLGSWLSEIARKRSWGTNIGRGLIAAGRLAKHCSYRLHVLLLSDGHHNCWTDPLSAAEELKRRATIETVGIGGSPADVDEELLRAIASTDSAGKPRYHWIGDRNSLVRHFVNSARGISRS